MEMRNGDRILLKVSAGFGRRGGTLLYQRDDKRWAVALDGRMRPLFFREEQMEREGA